MSASVGWNSVPLFAVVDVETTGLNPELNRVVEIAVVRVDGRGRRIDEWSTRVNPRQYVGATHIHGLTDADVANAPIFDDIVPQLKGLLESCAVVAHNADFDMAFITHELAAAGWRIADPVVVCTMKESVSHLPRLGRRRLADCCAACGVELTNAHSALGDARAASLLLARYLADGRLLGMEPSEVLRRAGSSTFTTAGVRRYFYTDPDRLYDRIQASIAAAAQRAQLPRLAVQARQIPIEEIMPERVSYLGYFQVLLSVLEDGLITPFEASAMLATAEALQVDTKEAHKAFVRALARAAVDDGIVTLAERDELSEVASLLGLAPSAVTEALRDARAARLHRLSTGLPPLPDDWQWGEPLRVGQSVVFTGCDEDERTQLESEAWRAGVTVAGRVAGNTVMLVTDGSFVGVKTDAARGRGTRVVTPALFRWLLKHIQPYADMHAASA